MSKIRHPKLEQILILNQFRFDVVKLNQQGQINCLRLLLTFFDLTRFSQIENEGFKAFRPPLGAMTRSPAKKKIIFYLHLIVIIKQDRFRLVSRLLKDLGFYRIIISMIINCL